MTEQSKQQAADATNSALAANKDGGADAASKGAEAPESQKGAENAAGPAPDAKPPTPPSAPSGSKESSGAPQAQADRAPAPSASPAHPAKGAAPGPVSSGRRPLAYFKGALLDSVGLRADNARIFSSAGGAIAPVTDLIRRAVPFKRLRFTAPPASALDARMLELLESVASATTQAVTGGQGQAGFLDPLRAGVIDALAQWGDRIGVQRNLMMTLAPAAAFPTTQQNAGGGENLGSERGDSAFTAGAALDGEFAVASDMLRAYMADGLRARATGTLISRIFDPVAAQANYIDRAAAIIGAVATTILAQPRDAYAMTFTQDDATHGSSLASEAMPLLAISGRRQIIAAVQNDPGGFLEAFFRLARAPLPHLLGGLLCRAHLLRLSARLAAGILSAPASSMSYISGAPWLVDPKTSIGAGDKREKYIKHLLDIDTTIGEVITANGLGVLEALATLAPASYAEVGIEGGWHLSSLTADGTSAVHGAISAIARLLIERQTNGEAALQFALRLKADLAPLGAIVIGTDQSRIFSALMGEAGGQGALEWGPTQIVSPMIHHTTLRSVVTGHIATIGDMVDAELHSISPVSYTPAPGSSDGAYVLDAAGNPAVVVAQAATWASSGDVYLVRNPGSGQMVVQSYAPRFNRLLERADMPLRPIRVVHPASATSVPAVTAPTRQFCYKRPVSPLVLAAAGTFFEQHEYAAHGVVMVGEAVRPDILPVAYLPEMSESIHAQWEATRLGAQGPTVATMLRNRMFTVTEAVDAMYAPLSALNAAALSARLNAIANAAAAAGPGGGGAAVRASAAQALLGRDDLNILPPSEAIPAHITASDWLYASVRGGVDEGVLIDMPESQDGEVTVELMARHDVAQIRVHDITALVEGGAPIIPADPSSSPAALDDAFTAIIDAVEKSLGEIGVQL